jgi:hypothetical protein
MVLVNVLLKLQQLHVVSSPQGILPLLWPLLQLLLCELQCRLHFRLQPGKALQCSLGVRSLSWVFVQQG